MIEHIKLFLDALTAVGAIAAAVGVYVAYEQLETLNKTLEDNRRWNKVISAFSITPNNEEINTIEEELNESFIKIIDRTAPLSAADVEELCKPENARLKILLKNYLNELESYCTAINVGAVCEETAKRKYSHKIKRLFLELRPYIERLRTDHNEPTLFIEIEQVVKMWEPPIPAGRTY
ncbi:MAG TPA: DUF4760 domain-containing protein [Rhodocyclaceae bacterium]|jgi:hypothetical protein